MKKCVLCFNINGCPNRCKHCYLDGKPNKNQMNTEIIEAKTNEFIKLGYETTINSWYLEPDYCDDYKEMFEWEQVLSTIPVNHFELASNYRLVRDRLYAPWLKEIGVDKVQLTFFGMELLTNYYTGRNNAFKELLKSIDILLENKILPRIQYFIYSDTVKELPLFLNLIKELKLEERCMEKIGREFEIFIHTGSCTGRAIQLYDKWITIDEIRLIPSYFINKSLKYFGYNNGIQIFGKTEKELYTSLIETTKYFDFPKTYVFYIDEKYDVYPNNTSLNFYWKLGNLLDSSAEDIISKYHKGYDVLGKHSISDMVKQCGDKNSTKLFLPNDYINYIVEKYAHYISS